MASRRAYNNSLRAAQADRTAERILDATIALFGSPNGEITVATIAEKARISAPTVYKHFPNRQAIFEAVQSRINERFGRPPLPRSLEEFRSSVPRLHRFFAEQEPLVRAVVTVPELRSFWDVTRKHRDEGIQRAVRRAVAHLPKNDATALCAIAVRLVGVEGWLEMKDRWHLDDTTITRATQRALDALFADLKRDAGAQEKRDGK